MNRFDDLSDVSIILFNKNKNKQNCYYTMVLDTLEFSIESENVTNSVLLNLLIN